MLFKIIKIGAKSRVFLVIFSIALLSFFLMFSTMSAYRIDELIAEKENMIQTIKIRCSLDAVGKSKTLQSNMVHQFTNGKYRYLTSDVYHRAFLKFEPESVQCKNEEKVTVNSAILDEKALVYGVDFAKDTKFQYCTSEGITWLEEYDESFFGDSEHRGIIVPENLFDFVEKAEFPVGMSFSLAFIGNKNEEGEYISEISLPIVGYYTPSESSVSGEEDEGIFIFSHLNSLYDMVDRVNQEIENTGNSIWIESELFEFVLVSNELVDEAKNVSNEIERYYEEHASANANRFIVEDYFYEKQLLQVDNYIARQRTQLVIFVVLTFFAGVGISFVLSYMRSRERALMRTLGVSKKTLLFSVFLEGVFFVMIAFVISVLLIYFIKGMVCYHYYSYAGISMLLYIFGNMISAMINNRKNLLLEVKKTMME